MILVIPHYYIGVDLGQKCDFTAISVLERIDGGPPHFLTPWNVPRTRYNLRHLERVSLGTPYPRIVQGITALTREPALQGRCTVVLDGTGVGAPVLDMLKKDGPDCEVVSVTITGGEHASRNGHGYSVPKRDLLAALIILIEDEQLQIAAGLLERRQLVAELMAMQAGATHTGHRTYNASGPITTTSSWP